MVLAGDLQNSVQPNAFTKFLIISSLISLFVTEFMNLELQTVDPGPNLHPFPTAQATEQFLSEFFFMMLSKILDPGRFSI